MPSEVITLQLGQCGNQSMNDCHHLTKKIIVILAVGISLFIQQILSQRLKSFTLF